MSLLLYYSNTIYGLRDYLSTWEAYIFLIDRLMNEWYFYYASLFATVSDLIWVGQSRDKLLPGVSFVFLLAHLMHIVYNPGLGQCLFVTRVNSDAKHLKENRSEHVLQES